MIIGEWDSEVQLRNHHNKQVQQGNGRYDQRYETLKVSAAMPLQPDYAMACQTANPPGGRGNIELPAATNFGQENRIGSEHLSEGYPLDKQWG